jgi:F-type H+-transporting ATPase subunit b
VRSAAADAAVAAAEKIIATAAKGKVAEDLLARGIAEIRQKFN